MALLPKSPKNGLAAICPCKQKIIFLKKRLRPLFFSYNKPMNYTSNNPSLRYLEHIEYYKQMHNKGIKFADGNSIGDIGYEGSLVRLTLEPAKRGLEVYKQMLSELGRLGYSVSVAEDGRVIGTHIISNKEGKSIDDANTYNRVLDALSGINEATVRSGIDVTSETSNYERIVKKSGLTEAEFNLKTREIIDQHMDILGREYGDKNIYRDPVKENPMWEFFKQAKGIEAAERVYMCL